MIAMPRLVRPCVCLLVLLTWPATKVFGATSTVIFSVDSGRSALTGQVKSPDIDRTFVSSASGTLHARFFQETGGLAFVHIIEADLRLQDVDTSELHLNGVRLLAGPANGFIGEAAPISPAGDFFLQTNSGADVFGTFQYATLIHSIPVAGTYNFANDVGTIQGSFVVNIIRNGDAIELRVPVNTRDRVDLNLGDVGDLLNPDFFLTGELVAQSIQVIPDPETGQIIDFLLGIAPDSGNLNTNFDDTIDAGDVVRSVNDSAEF